jgi:hypothetical protein
VWGPKTAAAMDSRNSITLANPFIAISELKGMSEREVYYLRSLHSMKPDPGHVFSFIINNLRKAYGFTLGDGAMRYAVLAWEAARHKWPMAASPSDIKASFELMALFHRAVKADFDRSHVDESHCVAFCFAVLHSSWALDENTVMDETMRGYQRGAIVVLQHLEWISKRAGQKSSHLSDLVRYVFATQHSLATILVSRVARCVLDNVERQKIEWHCHVIYERFPFANSPDVVSHVGM